MSKQISGAKAVKVNRPKTNKKLTLFIVPFIVLCFLFSYFPLHGWIYAFYDYKPPLPLSKCQFVGFQWFKMLFGNETQLAQIVQVMKNTFAMSLLGIATSMLPLFFAILLNEIKCKWFKTVVQTLTTLPNFISWVMVYSVAFCLFSNTGMVNTLLQNLGLITEPLKFLDSDSHTWLAMLLWNTWKGLGWGAIMYLASITGIDQELYEAAKVDGANRFQLMRHITFPSLLPTYFVSNEYGGECYCENCENAFRVWLKEKYQTIENLNRAWDTAFWGHTFYDWDEIVLPNLLSEHFAENRTTFQGISLDYRRFNSEGMLKCFQAEYDAIKSVIPDAKITTNLMGFYKPLDYQKWAKSMDFISWDNYPANEDPYSRIAMNHDLMRGIKGGQPFALMEQTPSVTNWLAYNALKRPGVMRLWSYQAMAHGADTVMFFQMRRSIGACEKYHGAVIDHVGNENTRVFREIAAMGQELKELGDKTLGARYQAKAAVFVDWDNWWGIEYSAGPSCDLRYLDEVFNYYRALEEQNYAVDIIGTEDNLEQYDVVIAPILYMTKGDYDTKIRSFVKNGGTFVTTFFSGYVDEHDLVITGGYPGRLRDILGIWVEESDALPTDKCNHFIYNGDVYQAKLLCDIMHLEGAVELSEYQEDFYAQTPVITVNEYGKGKAYYVGTRSTDDFYRTFVKEILEEKGIHPVLETPEGVEATERFKGEHSYLFVLNHKDEEAEFVLKEDRTDLLTGIKYTAGQTVSMNAKDVLIFEK